MEKYYVVGIEARNNVFERRCITISEAYDAIEDASEAFGIITDMDDIMKILVGMKYGNGLTYQSCGLQIWASNRKEDSGKDEPETET